MKKKRINWPLINAFIVAFLGVGIIFSSTLLPDTDRNGIAGLCIIGGVILGSAPTIKVILTLESDDER